MPHDVRVSVMRICATVGGLLAPIVSQAATASSSAEGERIYGGEPAETCAFPTCVGNGGCSGTLIHPRVVLYAGHCGSDVDNWRFGEDYDGNVARRIGVERCRTASRDRYGDAAYCVLEQAVDDVPIAPVLYGCEVDILQRGQPVWFVGFGKTEHRGAGYGVKYAAELPITNIRDKEAAAFDPEKGATACNGDSGGPGYVEMPDGTFRTWGISSWGRKPCGDYEAWYALAHVALPWIQSKLIEDGHDDIDLTPCFEDDGTWAPGPECGGFPMAIDGGYGAWDNGCSEGAPLGGPSATCGDPFDDQAPSVAITTPTAGTVIETEDEAVELEVTVEADDGPMGSGIAAVELWVDGMPLDEVLVEAPFAWTIELTQGPHEIGALARDVVELEAMAMSVDVEVTMPPDDETDSEETGDAEDTDATDDAGDGDDESSDADGDDAEGNDDEEDAAGDEDVKGDGASEDDGSGNESAGSESETGGQELVDAAAPGCGCVTASQSEDVGHPWWARSGWWNPFAARSR